MTLVELNAKKVVIRKGAANIFRTIPAVDENTPERKVLRMTQQPLSVEIDDDGNLHIFSADGSGIVDETITPEMMDGSDTGGYTVNGFGAIFPAYMAIHAALIVG